MTGAGGTKYFRTIKDGDYRYFKLATCKDCGESWNKQISSFNHWDGRCRSCAQKYMANLPEAKRKRSINGKKVTAKYGGVPNAKKFQKGLIVWNKGLRGFLGGDKHYNWRGGTTSLTRKIRICIEYYQWRKKVYVRDWFKCVLCGGTKKIEADHYPESFASIFHKNKIKTLEQAIECKEFWDINNGRTLCQKCHNKTRGRKPQMQLQSVYGGNK